MQPNLSSEDALLLVDGQSDFCPGGALPVPDGDAVIPSANRWIEQAAAAGAPVIASVDWHPAQHPSFAAQGGPWPRHCVQGTAGAALHPGLRLPPDAVLVAKGTRLDRDQYSAFDDTGLASFLRKRGVRRLWVGGLAEDVCVRASALDGAAEGFEVRLLTEATRALSPEGQAAARAEMRQAGVTLVGG